MKYSPSTLRLYYECPFKFKLAMEGVEPLPPTERMVVGKAIHEVIGKYYEIIPEVVTPKEVPLFLSQTIKELNVDAENLSYLLRGFRLFEERRLTWNMSAKPVAIEKYFERGLFKGILDAIFKRYDQKFVGVDWKSGSVSVDNVTNIIQGFVYTYIANLDEMIFVSLISGSETKLTARELVQFKSVLTEILSGIKAEKFEKKEGENCKNCEYSLACKIRGEDL